MTERLTLEQILRKNPRVDREDLDEAREMLARLREHGAHRKEYDLVSPFGGRRVTVLDDVCADPRPIRGRRP